MAFKLKGFPQHQSANMKSGAPMKGSPVQKSYKEAYKDADKSKYKTEAEFTKAAKAWNVAKYGTDEPTKESKKLVGKHEGDMTNAPKVTEKTAKQELANKQTTRKENYEKDQASKKTNAATVKSGDATRVTNKKGVVTGVRTNNKTNKYKTKTKKRTKAGKIFTGVGNIFRKKGKKKSVSHKVTQTENPNYSGKD